MKIYRERTTNQYRLDRSTHLVTSRCRNGLKFAADLYVGPAVIRISREQAKELLHWNRTYGRTIQTP